MSEEKIKEIMNKLVGIFVSRKDVLITNVDGSKVLIAGASLNVCRDPISGRTNSGEDVNVYISDIEDAVAA